MGNSMETQTIKLTVPARPEFLGTIRLLASSVASTADMDIDNVDDLRIAADELCYLLMSNTIGDPELELTFTLAPNHVVIEGRRTGWSSGDPLPTPSDLMVKILAQVVDQFDIAGAGDSVVFRASKDAATESQSSPPASG